MDPLPAVVAPCQAIASNGAASPREPFGRAASAIIVLVFLLAGHVWSLDTGLFLDDHAHYASLRRHDWSFRSAVESSRLAIVGEVLDLWGRPEAGLKFFRPVAFWIMKAEYTLVGWRPGWMHGFSLAWHYACALLVGALAMRCFRRRTWATTAACLMAVHPAHTATVYWIACQTELITTALLLAGVLAYARYAGWGSWREAIPPAEEMPRHSLSPLAAFAPGLIAVLCYALALGCRENAVLFPLVCWAGDRLCGTNRRRWFRWEHAAMLAVLGGYFALRTAILGGFQMPVRPYVFPPTDPGFAEFILTKTVYYTLGLFGLVPVIPMGGQAFFATRPIPFYGGFAAIMAVLTLIWAAYRFRRALLWPAVWTALLVAPTLPVFASSHHLYLPGVGAVLLLTAGLAAAAGLPREAAAHRVSEPIHPQNRRNAARRALVASFSVLLIAGLTLMTWASGFAYLAGTRAEDLFVRDVISRGRPLKDGDHLFFINMPLVAYYAVPAIEAQTGRQGLKGHLLTFSPDLLMMEAPGEMEIIDDRQIRVRAPAGRAYFEGVTGRALLEVMGLSRVPDAKPGAGGLVKGQPIPAGLFTVTPTRLGQGGVEEFLFTFQKPIDSPEYHFFFGSPQFLAYPIQLKAPAIPRRGA